VDFTHAGDLKVFVDEEQLESLEEHMQAAGYLDGTKMSMAFNMLRASELIWPYFVNNYLKGQDPLPFDLLFWNADSTRMAAANHAFYLRNCYLKNALTQNEMILDGKSVSLKDVKIPIYNLATREDHIAPAKSVFFGSQFFGGKVEFVVTGSGHIAGVVNPPDRKKYQYWTGGPAKGDYETWLEQATETPGSWWPHWQAWIETHDVRLSRKDDELWFLICLRCVALSFDVSKRDALGLLRRAPSHNFPALPRSRSTHRRRVCVPARVCRHASRSRPAN
ncbi:PHA/PHB synthase family protein, partial [Rhizobium johnstonii]